MNTKWIPLVAVFLTTLFNLPLSAGVADRTLDIYWIDSEGGGSTLIVTPSGESLLVDSGNPGGRDPGRIYEVASKAAGLKKIDHLVTTHFDIDHFGGAAEVAAMIPIGQVYDNGLPEKGSSESPQKAKKAQSLAPYQTFKADQRSIINPGDEIHLKQANGLALRLRCVAARQKFIAPPATAGLNPICSEASPQPADTTENANSIALLLEYGPFRFFDGADLTLKVEGELVCPTNRIGRVDVFQVDHHGLDVSNNPMLLRSLEPIVTIMCNGPRKGAGPQTMATLRGTSSIKAMYQLHKNLRSETENCPPEFIANQDEKCQANYIRCSVEPSGKAYTVSIPGTGHARRYSTRQ